MPLTSVIVVIMTDGTALDTKFNTLLREQIRSEFTASQQYIAIAVYCDGSDLPRLATHFYAQAVEERNHAMMLVQYLLDRDLDVEIPGTDAVLNKIRHPGTGVATGVGAGAHGHRANHPAQPAWPATR